MEEAEWLQEQEDLGKCMTLEQQEVKQKKGNRSNSLGQIEDRGLFLQSIVFKQRNKRQ